MNFDHLTTWHLADLADSSSPDRSDGIGTEYPPHADGFNPSPGAIFLRRVARDTAEAIDYAGEDFDPDDFDAFEVADAAVPIYTHERWQVFVDLAAYTEDPSELGYGYGPGSGSGLDMEQLAGVCLYMIAERLAMALVAEWADTREEVAS